MSQVDKIKIKATIEWAFLQEKNEMSEKYQVDLTNLSDAAVDALKSMGITANSRPDKPEKGNFITCKSSNVINAYLPDGSMLDPSIRIGNGTKATCVLTSFEWTFKNKKGISPSIRQLVITDLVQYTGSGDDDMLVVDEDGDVPF
jgi:hypothetical protein